VVLIENFTYETQLWKKLIWKTKILVADSWFAWGKRWILRPPDYFSTKHPPSSEIGLINSAGHRGGSGAVLTSGQLHPSKATPPQSHSDPLRTGCRAGRASYGKTAGGSSSENEPLITKCRGNRWGGKGGVNSMHPFTIRLGSGAALPPQGDRGHPLLLLTGAWGHFGCVLNSCISGRTRWSSHDCFSRRE